MTLSERAGTTAPLSHSYPVLHRLHDREMLLNMKLLPIVALVVLANVATAKPVPPDLVAPLAAKGMENLRKFVAETPIRGNCTLENAAIRKEWLVTGPLGRKS